jgi:Zn-finger nucleic acid-binding protein
VNQPTACPQCRGAFELYEFENVPALFCALCGEVWLGAEVAQLIESVIKRHPQPKRYHQVPVFSLAGFSI